MVRANVLAQKIATARTRLEAADEVFAQSLEGFLNDEKERDLATFYLFLAIQECIDIAAHWVADADWGPPEDAASAFEILSDKGILDRKLAQRLRGATGLRNRIAHGYTSVDPERMHAEYKLGRGSLRQFLVIAAAEAGL